jgi:hypothetical protein
MHDLKPAPPFGGARIFLKIPRVADALTLGYQTKTPYQGFKNE